MALPSKRHSKTVKRIRRAAIKMKTPTLSICPQCKKSVRPHTACAFCGIYRGRQVLKIKLTKKEKKLRKKEDKEKKEK